MKLIHLFELSMSPSALEAQGKLLKNDVKVGFEFEFALTDDSPLFVSEQYGNDTLSLDDIINVDQLYKYFFFTKKHEKKIKEMYEMEADSKAIGFADVNWSDFYEEDENADEDDLENQAKKAAYEVAYISLMDEFDINTYIENNIHDIVDQLDLEPRFGWYHKVRGIFHASEASNTYGNRSKTYQKIEDSLSNIFSDVSAESRGKNTWYITNDESISGDDPDETIIGVEVISPPLPLDEAISSLRKMFDWMNKNKVITNKSTGLHINVSTKNIQNLDPVKLALFLGEHHVADQFERSLNKYAQSQYDRLIKGARQGANPLETIQMTSNNVEDIIDYLKTNLSFEKYFSFNLGKLKEGYIEFRIAGNKDYHKDFEKVKNTTLRFASVIAIASDKNAYKNEYYKKLSQLFNKSLKDLGWKEQLTPQKHLYDWNYINQHSGIMWFRSAIRGFQREVESNNKRSALTILTGLIKDMFYEFEGKFTKEDINFIYSLMRIAKITKKELVNKILQTYTLDDDEQRKVIQLLRLS